MIKTVDPCPPPLAILSRSLMDADWKEFSKVTRQLNVHRLGARPWEAVFACMTFLPSAISSAPWIAKILALPGLTRASLYGGDLMTKALETGRYEAIAVLAEAGLSPEAKERWGSLMIQALGANPESLSWTDWPKELQPTESLVSQAAAFRLLNPEVSPDKLEAIEKIRKPAWHGFCFEACLIFIQSPGLVIERYTQIESALDYGLEKGWISLAGLSAAHGVFPHDPQTSFGQEQASLCREMMSMIQALEKKKHLSRCIPEYGDPEPTEKKERF